MSAKHRYKLEQSSKKYLCPNCNKKTFVFYVDIETGNYLAEHYGRCDREDKCGYFCNPYDRGYANILQQNENRSKSQYQRGVQLKRTMQFPLITPVFFDVDTFEKTLELERYEKNTFIQNLFYKVRFPFEADDVTRVVQLYRLGTVTHGYRAGAITFPFIDIKNKVRAIQVKQFDENNHTIGTDFLHSIIQKKYNQSNKPLPEWLKEYIKQDKRISCLFGEHLLSKYPSNPVVLVEAPKTAVYGTLYFGLPETSEDAIWLAVYNKSSFSFDKLKVLQRRLVFVFPDLSKDGNTFKEWRNKAKEYQKHLPYTRFVLSNLLEQFASEQDRNEGKDIGDYLIEQDWRLFRKKTFRNNHHN